MKLSKQGTFRMLVSAVWLIAALALPARSYAQAVRGTIQGAITDTSGAALPGVSVEAKNVGTGVVQTTVTNGEGRYTAPDLPLGDYEVTASLQGFQTVVRRGITLRVGSQVVVDFQLPVGQLQETLTVTGAAPTVDTVSSAVGAVVEQKQIADLPLNGRNFSQLISLAPGANEIPFGANGGSAFFGRQSNFTISGARPEGQAFLLDNTNIQGFWNRGAGSGVFGTTLGVEAISEFQTLTNTYSAQFGGSGSVINAVTKSGTNDVHGSLFEFYRNSKMDAKNFFDVSKNPFNKHQFGGSIGGPLKENKAFFFGTYEGIKQDLTTTSVAIVPDANVHNGIVNGVNVGVNPLIAPVLALYPLPTTTLAGGVGTIPEVGTSSGHENYALGRIDYNFSQNSSLFARYVSDTAKIFDPFTGSSIPLWGADQTSNNQYFTAEHRQIVSTTVINQVRFGLVRTKEQATTRDAVPALDFFPGENRENGIVAPGPGITAVGASAVMPTLEQQGRYTAADDVYITKGGHSLKMGGSLEWTRTKMDQPFLGSGRWTFPSLTAFLRNQPVNFIGAMPHAADSLRYLHELGFVGYVNDDWRAASKLTLNLGVRYNPAVNPGLVGGPSGPPQQIIDEPLGAFVPVTKAFEKSPHLKDIDPRVGFAYDPTESHKTSIRGGFGTFHNPIGNRIILPNYVNNPPYIFAAEVLTPAGAPQFPTPYASSAFPSINVSNGIYYHTTSDPYMMQWNVNVQREILANTSVTIGYVGSRGVNLLHQVDINPVTPRTLADGTVVYGVPRGAAPGIIPDPRENPKYSSLIYNKADSWSKYHSLQTSLNRRFSQGVQAQVSYTLSKCTDVSSGSFGGEGGSQLTNPYDADYDIGPCYFDRRHNFRGSAIWALPFKGNPIVEGWEVSTIVSAVSGRPFSPTIGFDQSGLGTGQRPSLAPGKSLDNAITGNYQQWFDPTVFVLPAAGTLGDVARNSLRGPKFFTTDLTLMRNVSIAEKRVQFRLEMYNITNHVNFNLPISDVFTQTPNGGGTYSGSSGRITSAGVPRQIQLAVRFDF